MRGATERHPVHREHRAISIHAPRAGATMPAGGGHGNGKYFNPPPPWGVRREQKRQCLFKHYFNPRTPCGVRLPAGHVRTVSVTFQSTHPVRGATLLYRLFKAYRLPFQSTHPVRGATCTFLFSFDVRCSFQSTHPVRGATVRLDRFHFITKISIHAPRAGCDVLAWFAFRWIYKFQSTHPVRGATTRVGGLLRSPRGISIHAPRAGCD